MSGTARRGPSRRQRLPLADLFAWSCARALTRGRRAAPLAGGPLLAALGAPRRPPAGRTHSPQPHLDAKYTVFGHVVAGMDVVDKLTQDDTIVRVRVWDGTPKPDASTAAATR